MSIEAIARLQIVQLDMSSNAVKLWLVKHEIQWTTAVADTILDVGARQSVWQS